jgi:glycosyltransferase involved in cell wall biosynthesis
MMEKSSKKRFIFLFNHLSSFGGGMQVYSAFLLQAWQQLYPDADYDIVLRCESQESANPDAMAEGRFKGTIALSPQTQFHYLGEAERSFNKLERWSNYIKGSLKIAWLILSKQPDLAITTDVNTYLYVLLQIRKITKTPYWSFVHGLEVWNVTNPSHRQALIGADKLVAASMYTQKRLAQADWLMGKEVFVLNNTFDADRFIIQPKPSYLLERYHLTPEQPVIFTATRIERNSKYKGYTALIETLKVLKEQIPDIHYILAGKGNDVSRVKKQVKQLGLESNVTLAGFIPDAELGDHYSLCDVFAMPSKGEGFGIVYLEALAAGKPVLAGNQDGSVDPLLNGKLGCLVNPDDLEEMSQRLLEILQGRYHNADIYRPQFLRQQIIEAFGFETFGQNLKTLLSSSEP